MQFTSNPRSSTDVMNNYYNYGMGWTELLATWPELTQIPWIYEDAMVALTPNGTVRRLSSEQAIEVRRVIVTLYFLYGAMATKTILALGGFYTINLVRNAIHEWLPEISTDVRGPIIELILSEIEMRRLDASVMQNFRYNLSRALGVNESDVIGATA